jgi:hypothetical protein
MQCFISKVNVTDTNKKDKLTIKHITENSNAGKIQVNNIVKSASGIRIPGLNCNNGSMKLRKIGNDCSNEIVWKCFVSARVRNLPFPGIMEQEHEQCS